MSQYHEHQNTSVHQQFMRDLDFHRFHNPLQPKTCYLCKVEAYRQENTPVNRWARAVSTAVKPPTPIAVMFALIVMQAVAIAVLLGS